MSADGKPTGSLAGKLMLSGALILASGAYAWRIGTAQTASVATAQSAPKLAALSQSATQMDVEPAPVSETPPTSARAAPLRNREEMPAARAEPQPVAPMPESVTPAEPAVAPPPAEMQDNPLLASTASPAPPAQKAGRYADGDYTGRPADAVWGLIQVRVSIRGGTIADIQVIDYPNHRRRSIQINDWALPMLAQEVIAAQSAQVDIVTQATTTSVGYRETVASALAQARP